MLTRLLLSSLTLLSFVAVHAAEHSQVYHLHIDDVLPQGEDVEVYLYHRDGAFHHGYATVPERDNLPHRVDVTPTAPSRFILADGSELTVPDFLKGKYSYKRPEFKEYRKQFEEGSLKIVPDRTSTPILELTEEGRLSGVVDFLIHDHAYSNTPGRNNHDLVYRLKLDLNADGKKTTASLWSYANGDETFGGDEAKREVQVTASLRESHWQGKAGDALADEANWIQQGGPYLRNQAVDTGVELVDNISDARLVWVAEDYVSGGRAGGLSRGGFAMFPIAWSNAGNATFNGVTVADGMVFQSLSVADEAAVAANENIQHNAYVLLGADPRSLSNGENLRRDAVYAFDVKTGLRKWAFFQRTFMETCPQEKQGEPPRHSTLTERFLRAVVVACMP